MNDGGEASQRLRAAVELLVRSRFGDGTRIDGEWTLSRRLACVRRLALAGGRAPSTVILKHLPAVRFVPDRAAAEPEFVEEQVAHRFLAELGADEGLTPTLLAEDRAGLTMLADLGPEGNPVMRSFGTLIPRLARAFADLHSRTTGHEARHRALRMRYGLPAADHRRHGNEAQRRQASIGREWLSDLSSGNVAEIDAAITRVEDSPRRAFLHDDVGNARQTYEVGDSLILLDFEQARFGAPLLDLMKPIMGKFERDVETGDRLWTCPGFPLALADRYRACSADGGNGWTDDDWRDDLGAALIFGTTALIGQLAEPKAIRLRGGNASAARLILHRLATLLASIGSSPSLVDRLGPLASTVEQALALDDVATGHLVDRGGRSLARHVRTPLLTDSGSG